MEQENVATYDSEYESNNAALHQQYRPAQIVATTIHWRQLHDILNVLELVAWLRISWRETYLHHSSQGNKHTTPQAH